MVKKKKEDDQGVKVRTKTVKLLDIKLNDSNPRTITEKEMAYLVKSLQDFPEMLEMREIVVDENMTVLGGNMRLRALQQIGAKECTAKIVTGLSLEQKREFVVKDNSVYGKWDMDALSSEWESLPLIEWGLDIPSAWSNEGLDTGPPKKKEPKIITCPECDAKFTL